MPANLPPQYLEAESRFRSAKSDEEKLEALEDMCSLLPRHKGTDKIHADIRRRISRIRKKAESRGGGPKETPYRVEKEGAAQVVLAGPPNAGKSSLASALSGVSLPVAAFPFTTRHPQPVIMPYLNVRLQLVDLPPITEEFCAFWQINLCASADLILAVIDLGEKEVDEKLEGLLAQLKKRRIEPIRTGEPAEPGLIYRKFLVVGNKLDLPSARDNAEILPEFLPPGLRLYPFSARDASADARERLKAAIWEMLDLIRVYSKPPQREADLATPFTLPRGATVMDLAAAVHKDFAQKFDYARIWGSGKFPGQTVGREHVLRDEDVLEVHLL